MGAGKVVLQDVEPHSTFVVCSRPWSPTASVSGRVSTRLPPLVAISPCS